MLTTASSPQIASVSLPAQFPPSDPPREPRVGLDWVNSCCPELSFQPSPLNAVPSTTPRTLVAAFSCGQELGKWSSGMGVVLDTESAEMPCTLHQAGSLQERVTLFLLPHASVGCVLGHHRWDRSRRKPTGVDKGVPSSAFCGLEGVQNRATSCEVLTQRLGFRLP